MRDTGMSNTVTVEKEMTIGPFSVGRDGSLRPTGGDDSSCGFTWVIGRHKVRCRMLNERLVMRAVLCRVPSTAEGGNQSVSIQLRQDVFAAVVAAKERLPKGWKIGLLPDHGIAIEALADLPAQTTGNHLISENVMFAIRLAPYLCFFDEIGAVPPVRQVDQMKDRPI
jgi:hypothetical protein